MLEKAEIVIKIKNRRIIILEKCIGDLGGKVPSNDAALPADSDSLRSKKKAQLSPEKKVEEIKNTFNDDEDKEVYFNPDLHNEEAQSSDEEQMKQIIEIDKEINDLKLPNEQSSVMLDQSPIIEDLKEELEHLKETSKSRIGELEKLLEEA
jgi:hypothetical protein